MNNVPDEFYKYKYKDYSRGGYMEDVYKNIPTPYIRLFPNPFIKRKVKVTISRYYGYGVHYYVTIKEEDNPVWRGDGWVIAWDDCEGRGKSDTDLYLAGNERANIYEESYDIALGKTKMFVKKYFPDHEIVWEDYCKDYEKQYDCDNNYNEEDECDSILEQKEEDESEKMASCTCGAWQWVDGKGYVHVADCICGSGL